MRRLLLGAVAMLVSVAVMAPASATHIWGPSGSTTAAQAYHWNKLAVPVIDSTTWTAQFNKTLADWNAGPVRLTVESVKEDSKTRKQCPYVSGKVRVCNASYGRNGWLGIAEIYINGGHITQARARMNDSYSDYWTYSSTTYPSGGTNAMYHVMCQEVGHDLGLGHQYATAGVPYSDGVTCMNDKGGLFDGGAYNSPNQHDYDLLNEIYGHVTTSSTTSNTATSPSRAGQGRLLVRHIFWAPGHGPDHRHDHDH